MTYLHDLTDDQLAELVRTAEHAERKAHVALALAPLGTRRVEDSAAVFQDARAMLNDAQDETILRLAAEFDRVWDLGGDNNGPPEYQPDEDSAP